MGNIKAFKIGWPLADDRFYEFEKGLYLFNSRESGHIDSLPVEFFSHQLMDVDASNDEEILSFASDFGIPMHPSRYGIGGLPHREDVCDALIEEKKKGDSARLKIADKHDGCWTCATLEEARITINDLQAAIDGLLKCVSGESDSWYYNQTINAGAVNAFSVHEGIRTFPDNSLTNAICNQVIETIADEAPWRLCGCEGCGRPFKHHQPRKGVSTKTGKNPSRSKYCCLACQNRQGQRNRREAAKNRIQH